MSGPPERWALVRLGHLGDVALTTGPMKYWHERRGWRFTVITKAANAPILAGHPAVDEVVAVTPEQLTTGGWSTLGAELAARHEGHGLLDLHGTLRTRLLARAWRKHGGPVRRSPKLSVSRRLYAATPWRQGRGHLLATNVPQRYALAVERAAPGRESLLPNLHVTPGEAAWAEDRLTDLFGEDRRPVVALHPYATHPLKAWPQDRWRELVPLLEERGWRWFVLGVGESFLGGPTDLTGATDLRQAMALLSRADTLVTGDSGPMHLACGVGTPVVALFGPTDAAWGFYPAGPRDMVLETPLACRPCSLHGARDCRRGKSCLTGLTGPMAVSAVATTLGESL